MRVSSRRAPRVAVAIPAFNHEKYIAKAIHSVAEQGLAGLELHVLDDGSDDATLHTAERSLASHKSLEWSLETHDNQGSARTLNRLIDGIDSDYVAILNSDDYYLPGRLLQMLEKAQAGSDLFFGFSGVHFHPSADPEDFGLFEDWYRAKLISCTALPSCGFALIGANLTVTSSNFFFSRELFDLAGGFEPNLTLTQDWQFVVKTLQWNEPELLPERLLAYRVHPENTYRRLQDFRFEQSRQVLQAYTEWADSPCLNPLAPTPAHWASFFPFFARMCTVAFSKEPIGAYLPPSFLRERLGPLQSSVSRSRQEEAVARLISVAQAGTHGGEPESGRLLCDVAHNWNRHRAGSN